MNERFIKNLLFTLKEHRAVWELYDIENYLKQELKKIKERQKLLERVKKVLIHLSPREQKILKMRFGWEDGITHTLEEVGKEFICTRERIRQIEAKAIERVNQHYETL